MPGKKEVYVMQYNTRKRTNPVGKKLATYRNFLYQRRWYYKHRIEEVEQGVNKGENFSLDELRTNLDETDRLLASLKNRFPKKLGRPTTKKTAAAKS